MWLSSFDWLEWNCIMKCYRDVISEFLHNFTFFNLSLKFYNNNLFNRGGWWCLMCSSRYSKGLLKKYFFRLQTIIVIIITLMQQYFCAIKTGKRGISPFFDIQQKLTFNEFTKSKYIMVIYSGFPWAIYVDYNLI